MKTIQIQPIASNVTVFTMEQLREYWAQKAREDKYLWQCTARSIANSIERVVEGKNTKEELITALKNTIQKSKMMAICVYYEQALEDLQSIK